MSKLHQFLESIVIVDPRQDKYVFADCKTETIESPQMNSGK